jgi:hypothetical protein
VRHLFFSWYWLAEVIGAFDCAFSADAEIPWIGVSAMSMASALP